MTVDDRAGTLQTPRERHPSSLLAFGAWGQPHTSERKGHSIPRGAESDRCGALAAPESRGGRSRHEGVHPFCKRWPQIDIEISGAYVIESLFEQKADVAIRFMPAGRSPDSNLHGRRIASAHMAVYGRGDCWIGQRGAETDRQWVEKTPWPDLPIKGAIIDGELQRSACAAGLGLARLPCFLADGHLERRSEPEHGLDIWVLVHPDLRRNPRLRLFRDMIVTSIQRQRARLEGRPCDLPLS